MSNFAIAGVAASFAFVCWRVAKNLTCHHEGSVVSKYENARVGSWPPSRGDKIVMTRDEVRICEKCAGHYKVQAEYTTPPYNGPDITGPIGPSSGGKLTEDQIDVIKSTCRNIQF